MGDESIVSNKETIHISIALLSTFIVFCIVNLYFKKPFNFIERLPMNDLQKDILTAAVFITGLVGFISGEFIISSTLFASAAIVTNLKFNRKQVKVGQY